MITMRKLIKMCINLRRDISTDYRLPVNNDDFVDLNMSTHTISEDIIGFFNGAVLTYDRIRKMSNWEIKYFIESIKFCNISTN
jgi:hypothetical protein